MNKLKTSILTLLILLLLPQFAVVANPINVGKVQESLLKEVLGLGYIGNASLAIKDYGDSQFEIEVESIEFENKNGFLFVSYHIDVESLNSAFLFNSRYKVSFQTSVVDIDWARANIKLSGSYSGYDTFVLTHNPMRGTIEQQVANKIALSTGMMLFNNSTVDLNREVLSKLKESGRYKLLYGNKAVLITLL